MEARKRAILKAVVQEFTTSAVPVGSQILANRYFLNLSSATIRNELSNLADLGYLVQPHTSAGRIPSDQGYRYFVDFLMETEPLPRPVKVFIEEQVQGAPADGQLFVERVAMVVAAVTHNASVVSAAYGPRARIKHLDLVSLDPQAVLLILLMEGNLLRQQVIEISQPVEQGALSRLAGRILKNVAGKDREEVGSLAERLTPGVENEVLEILEESRHLSALLRQLIMESDLQVVIGSENLTEQLRSCTVVLTTYGPSGRLKGTLGVVGPTRMQYGQIVARLGAVARAASQRLAEIAS